MKILKINQSTQPYTKYVYDDVKNELTIASLGVPPLQISLGNNNMHDDGVIYSGYVNGDQISNCIHQTNGKLNVITATFKFTTTQAITDNNTNIKFNGDFVLPEATFLNCWDITTATPQQIQFYWIGTNQYGLYGAQANHTYAGTFSFSYIGLGEGGSK